MADDGPETGGPQRTPLRGFHHLGISVPDLEAAIAWYGQALGFELERRFEVPRAAARVAYVRRDDLRIEIFEVTGAEPLPEARRHPHTDLKVHGNKHVAFAVHAYDALRDEMTQRGVETVLTVGESFGRAFFIRDGFGNVIEFVEV